MGINWLGYLVVQICNVALVCANDPMELGSTERQNERPTTLDTLAGLHVKGVVAKRMFKGKNCKLRSGSWVLIAQLYFDEFLMLCGGWDG